MAGHRGAKRPSIFEVAKLAGVSHQTVSRVINHSPNVAEATRAKVEHAIAELGYHPSNSARSLASNRTRTVGHDRRWPAFLRPGERIGVH